MTGAAKTAAEVAAEQAAFWNGPGGQGWLATYQRISRGIAGFGTAALAAAQAQPAEQVIDVGCGSGDTTAALARAVGATGHVLGVDISEPLIAAARAHRVDHATFVVGDAATHPFKAAQADLVFSRFGVMFFAEPVAAFRNLLRALKPEGRLVFVCWRTQQENPFSHVALNAARPFLPAMPKPGPEDPGQFAFGDRGRVERILKESGFVAPTFEPLDQPVWLGKDAAEFLANAERFGVFAKAFAEGEPAAVDKAKAAIAAALAPHQGPEGLTLPGACWLVTARAR